MAENTRGAIATARRILWMPVLACIVLSLTVPAQAQFSKSYNFLQAVKDRDGTKATEIINEPGSGAVIINTRDRSSGETALHIVVQDRDTRWTGFLLQKGANPDVKDKEGVTPLMLATRLGFEEGIDWLIRYKANIDAANRSGETALILAVQLNKPNIVRILMKAGADPDITDNLAGLSARDYAARDPRRKDVLKIIENADKDETDEKKEEGELDFSGIGEGAT